MKTDGILSSRLEAISYGESLYSSSVRSLRTNKTDMSTFIEELEETTERLMNEVFALPSLSEIKIKADMTDLSISKVEMQTPQKATATSKIQAAKVNHPAPKSPKRVSNPLLRVDFATRSKYQYLARKNRLAKLLEDEEQELSRIYTYRPKINKSELDIQPIQYRAQYICSQKYRKLHQYRTKQKIAEDELQQACTFTPQVNHRSNPRTTKYYYEDKLQWEKRRLESIEKKQQLAELRKNKYAVFQPEIVTTSSSFYRRNLAKGRGSRVEDRLLESLERSAEKLRKARTEHF